MTSRERGRRWMARAALGLLGLALLGSSATLRAQDKAVGVFDDEKPGSAQDKDKDKAQPKTQASAQKGAEPDPRKPAAGSAADRDVIGFNQQNAASQMTELEERMFRLAEALRSLEPENASRLRLALKFSKEELILDQMRETNKLLKDAQLHKAETEVRELLAKLQHLRDVLTAEDLDFQLKLARLRQMRETLGQLARVGREEERVLGWSRFALAQRAARPRLLGARDDLARLGRDGDALRDEVKALVDRPASGGDPTDRRAAVKALRDRAAALGKAAAALALDPTFADYQPSQLRTVEGQVTELGSRLDAEDLAPAVAEAQAAAATLAREGESLAARVAEADRAVTEAEFRRREADQQANRRATGAIGAAAARLGDAGVALQKDMIRAASGMESAESHLAHADAAQAAPEQTSALETLGRAIDELTRNAERLLVELRVELQRRLLIDLAEIQEAQNSYRETAAAQAPRLAQKSRTAALAVTALAQKEADLAGRGEHLLALVEECEFGIALPTTLRVLSREMRLVEGRLRATDASPRVVAIQKRIEDDLPTVMQAVRRLPPTTPPVVGLPLPTDARERERELNRLIAELKLVRLLQVRLNDDTTGVDQARAAAAPADPAPQREVEALEANQEEIRETLARIAERVAQP